VQNSLVIAAIDEVMCSATCWYEK